MLSEAPLLASDVVSPKTFAENRHLHKGSTVQDTGIPILSWSRGSPFDPIKALQPKSRGKAADLLSPNNMENYFCAPTGKEEKDDEDREEDDDDGEENVDMNGSLMTGPDLGVVQQKLDYGTSNDSNIFEESPTTKSEVSFGAHEPMSTMAIDTSDYNVNESDVVEEESAVIFGRNDGDEDEMGNDDEEEAEEVEDRLTAEDAANSLYSTQSVDPFSYNFPTQEVDTSVVEELALDAGDDERFADGQDQDQQEEEEDDDDEDDYEGYPATDFDRLSQDSLGSASLAGDGSEVLAAGEGPLQSTLISTFTSHSYLPSPVTLIYFNHNNIYHHHSLISTLTSHSYLLHAQEHPLLLLTHIYLHHTLTSTPFTTISIFTTHSYLPSHRRGCRLRRRRTRRRPRRRRCRRRQRGRDWRRR